MTKQAAAAGWSTAGLISVALFAITLNAQSPGRPAPAGDAPRVAASRPPSVQDALLLPFDFPFAKPATLDEVATHLGKTLGAPVALDRAALERLDIRPEDTVQLDLKGVRLKSGLKLLLDQLDLTYRVEAEDNMLVITDVSGADDPLSRVLAELKALHREMHGLQDDMEDVRNALSLDDEKGPRMRKPTIIEELPPGGDKSKAAEPPPTSAPPRTRSGA